MLYLSMTMSYNQTDPGCRVGGKVGCYCQRTLKIHLKDKIDNMNSRPTDGSKLFLSVG